jgi:hypothetical protein
LFEFFVEELGAFAPVDDLRSVVDHRGGEIGKVKLDSNFVAAPPGNFISWWGVAINQQFPVERSSNLELLLGLWGRSSGFPGFAFGKLVFSFCP